MKRRHEYFLSLSNFSPPSAAGTGLSSRPHQAGDTGSLAGLMLEASRGTVDYDGETLEDSVAEVEGWLAGACGGEPLPEVSRLAFDGPRLAGACLAGDWRLRRMPLICYVMTLPDWKNRGVGRDLLTEVLEALRGQGCREVRTVITDGNFPSERLFARMGFQRVSPAVSAADILLRPANQDDAHAVADVYLASRKQFLPFAPLAHPDDEVRRWIAEVLLPSGGVTVAVADEKVVGMMALSRREDADWIDQFYLHPNAAGRGIGDRLLALAVEVLGPRIRLCTFQANMPARRFYERHGFQPVAFTDGQSNEERCPDVLYEFVCGMDIRALILQPAENVSSTL